MKPLLKPIKITNVIQREDGLYYSANDDLFSNFNMTFYDDDKWLIETFKNLSRFHDVRIVSVHIELWKRDNIYENL